MNSSTDGWFVRLPDGRVLRATSTDVVRQHLGAGRIPTGSTVRRNPDDEWTSVEWVEEFADVITLQRKAEVATPRAGGRPPSNPVLELAPPKAPAPPAPPMPGSDGSGVAARLDPTRLQTVGVRGLVDELIGALDSTLVRKKITVALAATMVLGLLFAFAPIEPLEFSKQSSSVDRALAALAVLLVGSVATALVTRMTFVEVSRLRPARWGEAFSGLGGLSFRIAFVQIVVTGATLLLLEVLRLLPGILLGGNLEVPQVEPEVSATVAAIGAMAAEVLQWPVFGFSLLLAPILAVEGCSVGTALLQWFRLLRRQFGRVFVYEALTFGVGLIITLPLLLPMALFLSLRIYPFDQIKVAVHATSTVMWMMALGPLFAYMAVANVFVYLNLRYETGPVRK